mmetsp:Transcript_18625/g.33707  ORF Transcript_18625/g.33707 Transcript_18625/m.33707 type:complete len:90 (+) Transcript_18625:3-272(+)
MTPFEELVEVFTELVCAAQECIRRLYDGERSSASLRDVRRCVDIFRWFGEHFYQNRQPRETWDLEDFFGVKHNARRVVRKAVILSLAYC